MLFTWGDRLDSGGSRVILLNSVVIKVYLIIPVK
jgi:hypothetical protein